MLLACIAQRRPFECAPSPVRAHAQPARPSCCCCCCLKSPRPLARAERVLNIESQRARARQNAPQPHPFPPRPSASVAPSRSPPPLPQTTNHAPNTHILFPIYPAHHTHTRAVQGPPPPFESKWKLKLYRTPPTPKNRTISRARSAGERRAASRRRSAALPLNRFHFHPHPNSPTPETPAQRSRQPALSSARRASRPSLPPPTHPPPTERNTAHHAPLLPTQRAEPVQPAAVRVHHITSRARVRRRTQPTIPSHRTNTPTHTPTFKRPRPTATTLQPPLQPPLPIGAHPYPAPIPATLLTRTYAPHPIPPPALDAHLIQAHPPSPRRAASQTHAVPKSDTAVHLAPGAHRRDRCSTSHHATSRLRTRPADQKTLTSERTPH
ncbi:hypothetical protein HYPSUDRAFT_202173 [Hypholoma sublateritium FD-334 SS-4]|uniref:Uncharacterized protein n=1 Tax=Hypholoma sublateritium (strain FD-334 SS-4) TaxID=945553 RepID=A0A0D2MFJ8_HYPSF|nr:hypothetical protein HYPSUDRAFT_202173 [Hypholoma sublateritium FD-334 SS-4]